MPFQLQRQFRARPSDDALERAERKIEYVSSLDMRIAVAEAEQGRGPFPVRKATQRTIEVEPQVGVDSLRGPLSGSVEVALGPRSPALGEEEPPRDAQQPPLIAAFGAPRGSDSPGLEERLLREVVGALAAAKAREEGANLPLVPSHQLGEGGDVAARGCMGESEVVSATQRSAPCRFRYQRRASKAAPTKTGKRAMPARFRTSSGSPWISP